MARIVISSGHGKYIRGASGNPVPPQLDEVDEARRVVEAVADLLKAAGVNVLTFHDNTSHDQNTNLNTIVNFHNKQTRDLDVSVHFNCYDGTAHGVECLYLTQKDLADNVSAAIARAGGFTDRGPKKRTDLFFLNNTDEPAILIETCFCDNDEDSQKYRARFNEICSAIAEALSGEEIEAVPPPEQPPASSEPPMLEEGDEGPWVVRVQTILGIEADGNFGAITEDAVEGFQAACGLDVDGLVGPDTWRALDELEARKAAGSEGLSTEQIAAIGGLVEASAIADYLWRDRGEAPAGYTAGVACCFGIAALELEAGTDWARVMAQADRMDANTDALAWYRSQYQRLGMDNSRDGIDTLRHLFVMILGLGMRESSGRYCEGRDMSASNVQPDTAEAGAWQTSFNIRSCSPVIAPMLETYWNDPNGLLDEFRTGVEPSGGDLTNYGEGADGTRYQFLSKYAPAMHCFITGVGLRLSRKHWGPINRSEVELRSEADELLRQVQEYISAKPEPEVTTITITVDPPGSARVVVIGGAS